MTLALPQLLRAALLTSGAVPTSTPASPSEGAAEPTREVEAVASLEDGLGVRSRDGAFGVSLGLLGWLRYSAEVGDGNVQQGFSIPVVRPAVRFRLWGDRVEAWVMPELSGTPQLLDAAAVVKLHDAFAVEVGQDRPWLSRGYRTPLNAQALGERGLVVDTLRIDRDIGVTVLGRPLDGRLEYYVGALNGEGKNTTSFDGDLLYTARLVVAPLGSVAYDQVPYVRGQKDMRVALGASAYTVELEEPARERATSEDVPTIERRDVGATGDLVISGWRLAGMLEGFWRTSFLPGGRRRDAWGAYEQLAALIVRDRLDLAARVGVISDEAGVRVPFDAGFNVYFAGNHAKLQVRHHCVATPTRACAHQNVMAQLQLWI